MSKLLTTLLITVSLVGFGQQYNESAFTFPNLLWTKYLGDFEMNEGRQVIPYINDELLVIGETEYFDFQPHPRLKHFYFLNQQGELLRDFNTNLEFYIRRIIVESDGGFTILGQANCYGLDDFIMFDMDAEGNLLNYKCIGTINAENIYDVLYLDGFYYVVGWFIEDSEIPGNFMPENKGGLDIWIFKISPSGDLVWSKGMGGSDRDYAFRILARNNKELIVLGETDSFDGDFSENTAIESPLMIRLDTSGNELGKYFYYDSTATLIRSYTEIKNDSLFVFGTVKSYQDENRWLAPGDPSGFFSAMFSLDYKLGTYSVYGGSKLDWFNEAIPTGNDSYILTGRTQSNDGNFLGINPFTELHQWICTYQNGKLSNQQMLYNYKAEPTWSYKGYYLADDDSYFGIHNSYGVDTSFYTADKYSKDLTMKANDIRVFKLGSVSSTGLQSNAVPVYNSVVYPNPNNGEFKVKDLAVGSSVTIRNIQGQVVSFSRESTNSFLLHDAVSGIYMLEIKNKNQIQRCKLTVIK